MSILRCDSCGEFIDTDFDVESYQEEIDEWLCPACREARAALAQTEER